MGYKYCPDSKVLCRILQVREEGCPDVHIGGGVSDFFGQRGYPGYPRDCSWKKL